MAFTRVARSLTKIPSSLRGRRVTAPRPRRLQVPNRPSSWHLPQRYLPPSTSSPPHWTLDRRDVPSYKFTTGSLDLKNASPQLARYIGAGAYQAKIYSREPIDDFTNAKLIESVLLSLDPKDFSKTVGGHLELLWTATQRTLDLMPAGKDVLLQVLSRGNQQLLRFAPGSHRPHRGQIVSRGWSMGCRICVQDVGTSQCAKPAVDIQSYAFTIDGLCRILGLPSSHRGSLDLSIGVEGTLHNEHLGGLAGPGVVGNAQFDEPEPLLQQYVDAMREGVFLSLSGQTYATPADFLKAAKTAVESVFRSSQLAPCMILRICNIILQSQSRARIALHEAYQEGDTSAYPLTICKAVTDLSPDARQSTGAERIEVAIHHWHPNATNFYTRLADDLLAMLDQYFGTSPQSGLATIAASSEEIAKRFPVLLSMRFSVDFHVSGLGSASTTLSLRRNDPNALDAWAIAILVPVHRSFQILLIDSSSETIEIGEVELYRTLRAEIGTGSTAPDMPSLLTHTTHVAEIVHATLEQIAADVIFEDLTKVTTLLAESVLRTVRELTPELRLTGLSFRSGGVGDAGAPVVFASSGKASQLMVPRSTPTKAIARLEHGTDLKSIPKIGPNSADGGMLTPILPAHDYLPTSVSSMTRSGWLIQGPSEILGKTGFKKINYNVDSGTDTTATPMTLAGPQAFLKGLEAMSSGTISKLSSLCLQLCRTSSTLRSVALTLQPDVSGLSSEERRGLHGPNLSVKVEQGASDSLVKLHIQLSHNITVGVRDHANGRLCDTIIKIAMLCRSPSTVPDLASANASEEYWRTAKRIQQVVGPAVDRQVFDSAHDFAHTVSEVLTTSACLNEDLPWSEVQVTVGVSQNILNEKPAITATTSMPMQINGAASCEVLLDTNRVETTCTDTEAYLVRDDKVSSTARSSTEGQDHMASDPSNQSEMPMSDIPIADTFVDTSAAALASSQTNAGVDTNTGTAEHVPQDARNPMRRAEPERPDLSLHDAHDKETRIAHEINLNVVTTPMFENAKPHWKRGIVIALGSNMGDRIAEIEKACRAIDADPDMRIVDTSCLYESEPMYVEDQDRFINGVCEIETTLSPIDLLDRLQAIEQGHGRVKLIEKGPRNIDLDVLLYGDETVSTERLTIPHALMHERAFVLRPLLDLPAVANARLPKFRRSPDILLNMLNEAKAGLDSITPLKSDRNVVYRTSPTRRTHVMSILNTTPDSFSDGGVHNQLDATYIGDLAAAHIAAGATIIDVGGQSSRPNAPDVTAEEEIRRVIPAITAIRNLPQAADVAISVDTYRAAVAEAAITAGADIVNDISAGALDPLMLKTVARLDCTYIMMHMRGTPATMSSPEHCFYPDGLLSTVAEELSGRLDAAIAAGVRRWRIIIDPGLGFAKTHEQNIEILRTMSFRQTRNLNTTDYNCVLSSRLKRFPLLLGSSRKGFIGAVTGVKEPKDRVMGTAATVSAAVAAGADIVRVHDVAEMAQVVRMSDAIYRIPRLKSQREKKPTTTHAPKSSIVPRSRRSQGMEDRRSSSRPRTIRRTGVPLVRRIWDGREGVTTSDLHAQDEVRS